MPATSVVGRRPHQWYPLTEGPVIDLDALPAGQATDAAVDRLLRLHRGERVELRSASDPCPVWRRMDGLSPGGYGFAYLQEGPGRWRVQVTRRRAVTARSAERAGPLDVLAVTWASRTDRPGGKASPEELAAAARFSCFAMALALRLGERQAALQQLTGNRGRTDHEQ